MSPLRVLYTDGATHVLNKPAGLATQVAAVAWAVQAGAVDLTGSGRPQDIPGAVNRWLTRGRCASLRPAVWTGMQAARILTGLARAAARRCGCHTALTSSRRVRHTCTADGQ